MNEAQLAQLYEQLGITNDALAAYDEIATLVPSTQPAAAAASTVGMRGIVCPGEGHREVGAREGGEQHQHRLDAAPPLHV